MKNIFKTQKQDKNKKQSKKLPVMVWIVFGVLCMGVLAIATTISDTGIILNNGNVTISLNQINITASSQQQAIELRPYSAENGVVSIRFWDNPTSNSANSRVGEISAHGNQTSVGKNELNFYTTNPSGTMTNRFKVFAQESAEISNDLILVNLSGIADNEGDTINIGRAVVGGVSNVSVASNFEVNGKISDGTSAFIQLAENRLRLNVDFINLDTILDFGDVNSNSFPFIMWDKASYPGTGNAGFVISNNTRIEGALQLANLSSSGYVCDSNNEGELVYNATTHKHYGCNSTDWNALY